MTPRQALKAATDDVHHLLDTMLSGLTLSNPADYRRFLLIQARVVPPLERALDAFGMADHVPGWAEHRRAGLLQQDLAQLGEPMPAEVRIDPFETLGQALGAAYVLEGSRLGGRILERNVGPEMPTTFLHPKEQKAAWPALVDTIDTGLYADGLEEAKSAARQCFVAFLGVAREAGLQ
ncbi:biliverdin-producing heme oxygenase [Sphingomonas sabuli]|uniref:Biliverdin-producing heme oxygenase n=1 Tax=Sphingomonas sabuli TaxID=2764186 RepID=A0A7G9L4I6_9SPHN|nr:biliverdin-producing heme oxygenase [Sphingomonas sabuli]QNM83535.1 biliverdin-producing heme oxygenase [Sphingomonas sabuli]